MENRVHFTDIYIELFFVKVLFTVLYGYVSCVLYIIFSYDANGYVEFSRYDNNVWI
jgi:hypothetical protein